MIVRPEKGLFFVGTLLMCSALIYAAELAAPRSDPLERVFVGVPNQLSLPPGFGAPAEGQDTGNVAATVQPEPQLATEVLPASDAREPVAEPKPERAVLPAPLSDETRKSAVTATTSATTAGAAVVVH
jgi:hypothetical protein